MRNFQGSSRGLSPSRPSSLFLAIAACALTCSAALAASFSTVVIDPGHGGFDRGGIPSNIIPEKGVALDVARRLRGYLADAGFRTVMTRSSDTFVTLDGRVAIANRQRRAIFVSIHFYSARRRGANGIETFYGSAKAKRLASLIQRYAMKTTSGENRGIKKARFYVLRKSRIPAVLIECGFLTNRQDARRASRPAYRDQLARQIARAIIAFR
jgi:N-acetylmuramoyl-L-alanine amidase